MVSLKIAKKCVSSRAWTVRSGSNSLAPNDGMTIESTDKCSDRFLAASYQAGSKLNSKLGVGSMSNDIVERSINTRSRAIRFLQIVMTLSGTARKLFTSMAVFLSSGGKADAAH